MYTSRNNYLPYAMWLFPLLFFAYQFILRLWPGLMMQQMMEQYSISSSQFGVIAAFYYYGYSGMQIPVAMLLDRFGAKYIVFAFALLCGLATLLFTYSNNWYLACFSRFLVGAGSAVGFLGVSKVVSEWFFAKQYTRMIGLSFTVGLIGAIFGGKPISLLIEAFDWQHIAIALALISILIGYGAYCFLRPNQNKENNESSNESFKIKHFKALLSSPAIWLLALANLLMVGSLEGFSDVWGIPYLMEAYSINKSSAAQLISFVFFGMLGGGPLLAFCSKKLGNYTVIALCGFGMAVAFLALLSCKNYHWWYLASLFFSIGVMCCYQVIVFAAGANLVKAHYLGVTVAFLNCINMLGGSFFHTLIGKLMDMFWTGSLGVGGIKQYSLVAYQSALMLIPASACLGALIVCFLGVRMRQRQNLVLAC
ncbi:Major facilitator family transporter [Legionella fallonii LLAP-10]|uniref:Lysosomal dipeptide transporter MFSD1 n=2 Tax=Legionella fallonii TaxID=96230 RepID=A0A098GBV9_9GAMM|nr:MFS transporter [Legionella fallonii]CEG58971.1 Major facilitator family transporter [Legionella fallonii LLAP-10]